MLNGFGVFHRIFLSNILQSNCSQPTWLFSTQVTIYLPVQLLYGPQREKMSLQTKF